MTEFNAAMKQYLATTSRTLPEATNNTMGYVLRRAYLSLPPKDPQAKRNEVRRYLNAPAGERRIDKATGKAVGRGRIFRRVHLIAMARARKMGLPNPWKGKSRQAGADAMREAAKAVRKQSIGAVGYLKGSVVRAIKKLLGYSPQFGRTTSSKGKRGYAGDPELIRMAAQYNHATSSNVSMHKGAFAYVNPARNGFRVVCIADIALKVKPDQVGNVSATMGAAFQRAFKDEAVSKMKMLTRAMQADANEHNVKQVPIVA